MLSFFNTEDFMPHGVCILWQQDLLILHVLSDVLTGISYYCVSAALVHFVLKRGDIPFKWFFIPFGTLIFLSCGTTHFMAAWTFWNPDYGVEGVIKAVTASFSLIAAAGLWYLMPKIISLPSPAQLESKNLELQVAKESLARHQEHLEELVEHRTSELKTANEQLKQEIAARRQAEREILELNRDLEARVLERTRELELANKEMEAFTYSVSHDLRAPLRAIDGFSEALLEDYTDMLDEEGKTYLRYLQDGSRDMSELIEGLLKLSRSTRGELHKEQIDLSGLVKTVVSELRQAEPEQLVTVQVAADMQGDADPRLLKVVLGNLLGNAWKYSSQEEGARIEVGVAEQKGETVYFVKDNGVGFDIAFVDKLFLPFQRLHRADEFSGTGIGLATVERIIHRHGGRIWAEAAVGEGASFYFTLGEKGPDHG